MARINKLILATGNAGKIKEMTELLRPLQIEVIPQAELNISDAEEPGLTFVENALLKARHAARISGLPALADDSGLAVDALHGRPGIHSARYAGTPASSQKNIDKLLDEMKLVPSDKRQAQFHCVLALLTSADDPTPIICDGIWRGMILQQPQGDGGFGYDPVFLVPTENKSASQLAPDVKNKLSHRGKALRMLIQILKESQNC